MRTLTLENVAELAPRIVDQRALPLDYATHAVCPSCMEDSPLTRQIFSLEELPDCAECGEQCLSAAAILEIGEVRAEQLGLGDFVEGFGTKTCPFRIAIDCLENLE